MCKQIVNHKGLIKIVNHKGLIELSSDISLRPQMGRPAPKGLLPDLRVVVQRVVAALWCRLTSPMV
jgi:hypothetical protein